MGWVRANRPHSCEFHEKVLFMRNTFYLWKALKLWEVNLFFNGLLEGADWQPWRQELSGCPCSSSSRSSSASSFCSCAMHALTFGLLRVTASCVVWTMNTAKTDWEMKGMCCALLTSGRNVVHLCLYFYMELIVAQFCHVCHSGGSPCNLPHCSQHRVLLELWRITSQGGFLLLYLNFAP